jgi:hypothetical protein
LSKNGIAISSLFHQSEKLSACFNCPITFDVIFFVIFCWFVASLLLTVAALRRAWFNAPQLPIAQRYQFALNCQNSSEPTPVAKPCGYALCYFFKHPPHNIFFHF